MHEGGPRSVHFHEGYRITVSEGGVRIVTTSYHALPLEIGPDTLSRLGLRVEAGRGSGQEAWPAAGLPAGAIVASIGRAVEALLRLKTTAQVRADLDNLTTAALLLSGLDDDMLKARLRDPGTRGQA